MLVQDQIHSLLSQIDSHKDDYNWLANAALELSVLLYNLGEEMAKSRLVEEQSMIRFFNIIPADGGKKMTATEADIRAKEETGDAYFRLETNYKSILEIIMTIKKKLDVQTQQMRSGV